METIIDSIIAHSARLADEVKALHLSWAKEAIKLAAIQNERDTAIVAVKVMFEAGQTL